MSGMPHFPRQHLYVSVRTRDRFRDLTVTTTRRSLFLQSLQPRREANSWLRKSAQQSGLGQDRGTGAHLHREAPMTGEGRGRQQGSKLRPWSIKGRGSAAAGDAPSQPGPPLQLAEAHEDLVALELHLPVKAHDLHALHQRLQGLAVVFHAGTGAARGTEGSGVGHWSPTTRRSDAPPSRRRQTAVRVHS